MLNLEDLNTVKACETPFEFEYLTPAGDKTGVFISVVGRQSETFEKQARALAKEAELAKGLLQADEFLASDSNRDLLAKLAAARIVAWRGIAEPCTKENAIMLCRNNPAVFDQVIKASNDVGNFTML